MHLVCWQVANADKFSMNLLKAAINYSVLMK